MKNTVAIVIKSVWRNASDRFIKYINTGNTIGATNFPQMDLPYSGEGTHRILNIHQNKPGVMREINNILSVYNLESQLLRTAELIGYLVADVDRVRTYFDVPRLLPAFCDLGFVGRVR